MEETLLLRYMRGSERSRVSFITDIDFSCIEHPSRCLCIYLVRRLNIRLGLPSYSITLAFGPDPSPPQVLYDILLVLRPHSCSPSQPLVVRKEAAQPLSNRFSNSFLSPQCARIFLSCFSIPSSKRPATSLISLSACLAARP